MKDAAGLVCSFTDAGQSRAVVCKHPKQKHMAQSWKFFWNGALSTGTSKQGGAGIWMFSSFLAGPYYLQKSPQQLPAGGQGPPRHEKSCKNVSSFCSALGGCSISAQVCILDWQIREVTRGCVWWSLTRLQGCMWEGRTWARRT